MAQVRTYAQLEAELKKARDKALDRAAKEVVDMVKDEVIEREVYGAGSPAYYERTYDLKNSLRAQPRVGDTVTIDHDTSLIGVNLTKFQHGSPLSGGIPDSIPSIVHDGKSGSLFGDGYWRDSRPYMDVAKGELNSGRYKDIMMAELRMMGYKVK